MPTLEEIQSQVKEFLPKEVGVTNITAEGPKIVLTTDRMDVFIDHSDITKDLAKTIKKRILIRPPASALMEETEADAMIRKIVGDESKVTDIMFNPYQKEVMIEAEKLGNVIGPGGENIRKIIKATHWTPILERSTPLKSMILTSLRKTLWDRKVCRRRKEFLEQVGAQIYSKPDHTCDWIRVTPLGGASEVGRSCFIVQTPNSNILLDCGINVAASDPKRMFPDFRAMQLTIDDLDAVILSHAHLDHCLPPQTPVLTENGYKKIDEVRAGEKVIAMNWGTGKYEAAKCVGKTRTFGHSRVLTIKTPYSSVEASPNHRFFTIQNLRVKELEASELQRGILLPSNILSKADSPVREIGLNTDIGYDRRRKDSVTLPKTLGEELGEFIGYYIGDGHKSTEYSLRMTDSSKELLEHHKFIVKRLFAYDARIRHHSDRTKNAHVLEIANIKIIRFLERNFPELFRPSREKEVPEKILAASGEVQRSFVRGLADAEGCSSKSLKITTYSAKMLGELRQMLCNQGIPCTISNDNSVHIQSAHAVKAFQEKIGFASQRKSLGIDAILRSSRDREFKKQDLIPIAPSDLRTVLQEAGMLGRVHGSPSVSRELPYSLLDLFRRKSGYCTRNTASELVGVLSQRIVDLRSVIKQADVYAARRSMSLTRDEVSASTGLNMYQVRAVEEDRLKTQNSAIMVAFIKERVSSMIKQTQKNIELIEAILSMDVLWERINEIESKNNPHPYLVDIQVEKHQNFIAGNIIVHNCGFIPYLYRYGFDGPIYATKPTRDIMALLQLDAVEISAKEDKDLPFSSPDIKNMIEHVIPLEYREVADISPDIRLTLYNAGHILGSSVVHLHIGDSLYNIVYTGDIKFGETRLLNPADYEFPRLETLIMESTYGSRKGIQPKRKEAEEFLIRNVKETLARGGKVLIPVFGVGRSQEVLVTLDEYRHELGDVPVYIDGMVWEATAIHTAYPEYLKRRLNTMILRGANPFLSKNFQRVETKERIDLAESDKPCVIVTPSGMLTGGPSVEYFKRMAGNEKDTIMFVGYQAEGSLGRRVQKGMREVVIIEDKKPKNIELKINVVTVEGFSGHADRRQLLGYVKRMNPKPERILCVHGEDKSCQELARGLNKVFHVETRVPQDLDTIRIL